MDVRLLIGLALLSACEVDHRTHPVIPGSPTGPVGSIAVDSAVGDAGNLGDGGMLAGRVCLVTGLRDIKTCASTGAGGLMVTLGTNTTTTSSNGSFSIAAAVSSGLWWHVSGVAIQTSIAPLHAMASIPVIGNVDFQELEASAGVLEVEGQGSILAHVVSTSAPNAPVEMATATTLPMAAYATLYDGSTDLAWTQPSTGAHGAVWIPGLPEGTVELTVNPPIGAAKTVTGLPVADRAITFVTVEIPL